LKIEVKRYIVESNQSLMDHKLDKNKYLKKIKKNFPQLSFRHSRLTGGWDNVVLILDNSIVFRFPKKGQLKQFKRELNINPYLSTIISLPVPKFEYVPKDKSFVGYRIVKGDVVRPQEFKKFSPRRKQQIAKTLAQFLRQLHSIPVSKARKFGFSRAWSNKDADAWHERQANKVYKKLKATEAAVLRKIIADKKYDYPFSPTVIHQDLTFDHVLFTKKNTVAGIIDFGDMQISDPAVDIGCLWEYGEDFIDFLLEYYKSKDKHLKERAWAAYVNLCVGNMYYGITMKRPDYWKRGYELLRRLKKI
jgi:aminoglycoside 2''-phosphotransferase